MEKITYTKMHGTKNSFLVFNYFDTALPPDLSGFAKKLCSKEQVDGILLILPPPQDNADFCMRIINADGSEAEMCGNGIRCVARYLVDKKLTSKKKIHIATLAGMIVPEVLSSGLVKVDMGIPKIEALQDELTILEETFTITTVSMGNPHCVIFRDVNEAFVRTYGHLIELHPRFPHRTNVEFISVVSPVELRMLVWERGAAITMACGTGACASVAAAITLGKCKKDTDVLIHLMGGDLTIHWNSKTHHIFMTGPAEYY